MTQGRNALAASISPATSGMKYARTAGAKDRGYAHLLLFTFRVFLVPRHLDGFELRLIRRLGIVVEILERQHRARADR